MGECLKYVATKSLSVVCLEWPSSRMTHWLILLLLAQICNYRMFQKSCTHLTISYLESPLEDIKVLHGTILRSSIFVSSDLIVTFWHWTILIFPTKCILFSAVNQIRGLLVECLSLTNRVPLEWFSSYPTVTLGCESDFADLAQVSASHQHGAPVGKSLVCWLVARERES